MKICKTILITLITCIIAIGCSRPEKQSDNQLTKQEKEQGWELLFDGSTFTNWRGLGRDTIEWNNWKVENGMIHKVNSHEVPLLPNGEAIDGGDLITIDSFLNFELQWDWKILPDGNSGIKYNVSEEISKAHTSGYSALGFEYQILDDGAEKYKDLKPSQYTGSLYDMYPPHDVRLNPPGEFNHSRILLNGNHGEHWLNGIKVLDYNFGTTEFDSLFQLSKYAKYDGFKIRAKRHIVITNHTDDSWYKNIKIRRLDNLQ